MNSRQDVKLHKCGRLNKMEKRKEMRDGVLTPPKITNKNSKINMYNHCEHQMGYDYDFGSNKALKWMWQDFNGKMSKYLGKNEFVKKQSRMDKVRIKE